MAFVGRKPTNAPLTSDDIPNGIISAADLASGISGLITWQSVQTSGFTAVAGRGYPCNTTSAAFTVTLPASPSVGDTIILLDYAGTFATNNITLGANGLKIEGGTGNKKLTTNREAVTITYVDSTQGWVASSGVNSGTQALDPITYTVDFLVIAGGASGGSAAGDDGGGGGAGGYRTSSGTSGGGSSAESSLTFNGGTVYTITVGAGGASAAAGANAGNNGSNSSISGTGITTITSVGGGAGGYSGSIAPPQIGGSGGGTGGFTGSFLAGASGTANQGYKGGDNIASANYGSGGGGGAGAVGVNGTTSTNGAGGAGVANSLTGSSVTRAGGGGGGGYINNSTGGSGGTGGGGAGGNNGVNGTNGTANTGGGGGGAGAGTKSGGAGGKGVVILSMPDASYSGTTTGSPTVTTGVSGKTVLVFNDSGTYTG
jgi:hypothetical protein